MNGWMGGWDGCDATNGGGVLGTFGRLGKGRLWGVPST
jgi:hypothetical protein